MQTEALDFLKSKNKPLILSHVFPDPDAIGSATGLALGLNKLGKDAKVFFPDGIIPIMQSFVPNELVVQVPRLEEYDSIVIVDTANKERASGLASIAMNSSMANIKLETLNIDHHQSNDLWANSNFVDAKSPATAIIIYELLTELGLGDIGSDISNLLFAGLVDDTGSFRFSNSTQRAFDVAGKLVKSGAEPEKVSNLLYFSQSFSKLKLQARAIDDMKLFLDGRVAFISVTNELLNYFDAEAEDTEGLVDLARSVNGVEVAVFIRESKGKWKVSLRSKSESFSVNAVANVYGGGGHKAAAGCTVEGKLAKVEQKLITTIKRFLDEQQ